MLDRQSHRLGVWALGLGLGAGVLLGASATATADTGSDTGSSSATSVSTPRHATAARGDRPTRTASDRRGPARISASTDRDSADRHAARRAAVPDRDTTDASTQSPQAAAKQPLRQRLQALQSAAEERRATRLERRAARQADPLPPADRALYTGEPRPFTRLATAGLRLVDLALKPIGGLLPYTSLRITVFTDGIPPGFVRRGLDVTRTEVDDMPVWTLTPKDPAAQGDGQYVVALHGGAYTAQASLFHWITYAALARDTGATVIVPLYPLVSQGGTAATVVPQTADFLAATIAAHGADTVSVLGDSAGGGLAVAAVAQLAAQGSAVPARMVLLAPWLDATVSDPRSAALDPYDPLLDVRHLRIDGQKWAGDLDPADPLVSPLFGDLAGLPPTLVLSGSLDLLTPDSLRLRQLALAQGLSNVTFDFRTGLIHDWPIFAFLPDAIAVRPEIYRGLLGGTAPSVPTGQVRWLSSAGAPLG